MPELRLRTGRPVARLTPADLMARLSDDLLALASRMSSPARDHREVEGRINEGERIAAATRRLVRG